MASAGGHWVKFPSSSLTPNSNTYLFISEGKKSFAFHVAAEYMEQAGIIGDFNAAYNEDGIAYAIADVFDTMVENAFKGTPLEKGGSTGSPKFVVPGSQKTNVGMSQSTPSVVKPAETSGGIPAPPSYNPPPGMFGG